MTLTYLGVLAILAAIVGAGFEAAGVKFSGLSVRRQILLFVAGALIIAGDNHERLMALLPVQTTAPSGVPPTTNKSTPPSRTDQLAATPDNAQKIRVAVHGSDLGVFDNIRNLFRGEKYRFDGLDTKAARPNASDIRGCDEGTITYFKQTLEKAGMGTFSPVVYANCPEGNTVEIYFAADK